MCIVTCTTFPIIQFYNTIDGTCVSQCPQGYYADLSLRSCVLSCSISPKYYAYGGNNTCVFQCPNGLYGDNSTGTCVAQCPQTTL